MPTSAVSLFRALTVLCLFATNACNVFVAPPSLSTSFSTFNGCGNIFVYATSGDGTQSLVVNADTTRLHIALGETKTFDLEHAIDGLAVRVEQFARRPLELPYCTDVFVQFIPEPKRFDAIGGNISISLIAQGANTSGLYRAVVQIQDAVFRDSRGRIMRQRDPITIDAAVGWLPG